jgi:hypothetical protein
VISSSRRDWSTGENRGRRGLSCYYGAGPAVTVKARRVSLKFIFGRIFNAQRIERSIAMESLEVRIQYIN